MNREECENQILEKLKEIPKYLEYFPYLEYLNK